MNIKKYKKVVKACLLTGLLASGMTVVTAQAKTYHKIPSAMQGTWSMSSAKYCKHNDPSKLTVTSKKLQFWESSAKVSKVFKKGNYITVSMKIIGEGETWYEKKKFLLKNNNKKLIHLIDEDTEFVRYRCIPQ